MNNFIQTITGQGDNANHVVIEQYVEVHEPNAVVRVHKVQLTITEPKISRMSLVERRRRRAALKY